MKQQIRWTYIESFYSFSSVWTLFLYLANIPGQENLFWLYSDSSDKDKQASKAKHYYGATYAIFHLYFSWAGMKCQAMIDDYTMEMWS